MRVIDQKEIKIDSRLAEGNFSRVYICEALKKEYAYKEYNNFSCYDFLPILTDLTERDLKEEYLIPKYLVEAHNKEIGYLSVFQDDLKNLEDENKIEEIIRSLKKARSLLQELHENYGLVHGDIRDVNVLFNQGNPYFLDFDMAFWERDVNKHISQYISVLAKRYLHKEKADHKLDIYMFNVMTLKLLLGLLSDVEVLWAVKKEEIYLDNANADVKRLSKELVLSDPKHKYSGEYIVDYF